MLMNSKISYHPGAAVKIMDCHCHGEKTVVRFIQGSKNEREKLIKNKELIIKFRAKNLIAAINSLFSKSLR